MTDVNQTPERVLRVFANRQPAPELEMVLAMFYRGAQSNRIGIMQALNAETNEEEVLLVGYDEVDGEVECFPLALVLKAEDTSKYRHPDGNGGWESVEDSDGTDSDQLG